MRCPQCGAEVPPDFIFCDQCGRSLTDVRQPPAQPGFSSPPWPGSSPAETRMVEFSVPSLRVKSSGRAFPLTRAEMLIGRIDPSTGVSPEIDLSPEDTRKSVSRRHARLVSRNNEYFIAEEIGVPNGTFINGQRLAPRVMTPLRSGDELRLGQVELVFTF